MPISAPLPSTGSDCFLSMPIVMGGLGRAIGGLEGVASMDLSIGEVLEGEAGVLKPAIIGQWTLDMHFSTISGDIHENIMDLYVI